ncbi:Hypothetical predicted protein [Xyrichtys novacula]|uniref:Uncharacterized protein n=1 Tax=Xyrichtys novacula TaxID=13765 RepID=A0AAV1EMM3_XYRNO|nr:Hypothetical predicted protein [Xyrichtys novacula]
MKVCVKVCKSCHIPAQTEAPAEKQQQESSSSERILCCSMEAESESCCCCCCRLNREEGLHSKHGLDYTRTHGGESFFHISSRNQFVMQHGNFHENCQYEESVEISE